MTLGQIAGFVAALAAVALVALCAVPLLKLGGVLDEVRRTCLLYTSPSPRD